MIAKNSVELRGYVAKINDAVTTPSGTVIQTGRIACQRPASAEARAAARMANEDLQTDFFNFRLFNQQVENIMVKAGMKVGDLVSIEGSLRTDTWQDANKAYHERTFVNVTRVDILVRKQVVEDDEAAVAPTSDELVDMVEAAA